MIKVFTVALALLVSAVTPSLAQISESELGAAVIGMPIYTSDGANIGEVTASGTYGGDVVVIGEVGYKIGFGTRQILIPSAMANRQSDRITLTVTYDELDQLVFPEKEP